MNWVAALLWVIILWAAVSRGPMMIYTFVWSVAFGSVQMLPGDSLGGANILPQSVCAAFLIVKALSSTGTMARLIEAVFDLRQLGFLFAFLLWALFGAYVMPRLFDHQAEVFQMNALVPWPVALTPGSANLTQSFYMMSTVMVAGVFCVLGRDDGFRRHYLKALVYGGWAMIATGMLDSAMAAIGQSEVLEPFRTAGYALLYDNMSAGLKRMVGLMPEASVYGAVCVAFAANLIFLRPCYEPKWRDVYVPACLAGLIGVAILSTSSTAIAGLGLLSLLFAVNWFRRATSGSLVARRGLLPEAMAIALLLVTALAIVLFVPGLAESFYGIIDENILQKASSDSYAERSLWSAVGLRAFYATHGLGVGLGSARVSNWFVSILSSTGAFGVLLLLAFAATIAFGPQRRLNAHEAEFKLALRFAILPSFLMAALSGTTPDIGASTGAAVGLLAGLALGGGRKRTMIPDARTQKLTVNSIQKRDLQTSDDCYTKGPL